MVSFAAMGFFAWSVRSHIADMPEVHWTEQGAIAWLVSVLLGAAGVGLNGFVWHRLIADQGCRLSVRKALALCAVAQFGKYIPGNIGQHIGRVWLAQREGISVALTLATMLIEILWVTGVAVGLSVVALALYVDTHAAGLSIRFSTAQLSVIVALLMSTPWVGIWVIKRFLPHLAARLVGGGTIALPRISTALVVSVAYLLCFVLLGGMVKLQAVSLFGVHTGSFIQLTCLFAAAWLAGYVVPGAPAGLGIRESMMLVLMGPILGAGTVVGLAVTMRVTTSLADLLAYVVGVWLRRS